MTPRCFAWASAFVICALTASAALALPPTGAHVIFVRQNCSSFSVPSLCVQSMADVNTWLTTRTADSVQIDVGPGDWGGFVCNGEDHVTVRGAGREVTRLIRHSVGFGDGVGMEIDNCDHLVVANLTAHGDFAGVVWAGAGHSTWSDTDLIAGGAGFPGSFTIGWYDTTSCTDTPMAEHVFFDTRVKALGTGFNAGFYAQCVEHYFYGGEIDASPEVASTSVMSQFALLLRFESEFHAFGTTIVSTTGAANNTPFDAFFSSVGGLHAVIVEGEDAAFHAHGGLIKASAASSATNVDVTGIQTLPGAAAAHTIDTTFVVEDGGTGQAAVLIDGGGVAQVQ